MGPSIQSASSSTSIGGSTGLALFWLMPRHVHWHRLRVGLVVALILIFAGVVIDSLLSASWALDDGLLLAAAAVIALALLLTRGHGRSGGEMIEDSASVRE
jgi:uncharacterized membrane protein YfcA